MMHLGRVSAISFDLDDTLWPFALAVERAERALHAWLLRHAPKTADVLASPHALRELRAGTERERPDLAGDLRALRCESIRAALARSDEDVGLTDAAYDVFFAERQRVEFYGDVWPALQWLSERYPLVAVSNGNADLRVTGGHHFFQAALNPGTFGSAKPEAAIFHAAASAVGVPPEQMLHVGDDPVLDVAGALAAGLQAAWVVRSDEAAAVHWRQDSPHPQLIVRDLRALCDALQAGRWRLSQVAGSLPARDDSMVAVRRPSTPQGLDPDMPPCDDAPLRNRA